MRRPRLGPSCLLGGVASLSYTKHPISDDSSDCLIVLRTWRRVRSTAWRPAFASSKAQPLRFATRVAGGKLAQRHLRTGHCLSTIRRPWPLPNDPLASKTLALANRTVSVVGGHQEGHSAASTAFRIRYWLDRSGSPVRCCSGTLVS